MIGSLRAVETALIAIDAHAGIKVNTRRAWNEAGKAGCGRILVLTRLDTENIDFPGLVASIKEAFGKGCVPLNVPLGISGSLRGVANTLACSKRRPTIPKGRQSTLKQSTSLSLNRSSKSTKR